MLDFRPSNGIVIQKETVRDHVAGLAAELGTNSGEPLVELCDQLRDGTWIAIYRHRESTLAYEPPRRFVQLNVYFH